MEGFFKGHSLPVSTPPASLVPKCGKCGLFRTCNSPKMSPTGEGERRILIIGEAPGAQEDRDNKQFCGDSGQLLERTLENCGVDMRRDCFITNALICRPPKNRTPTPKEIGYCQPNLIRTIRELKPEVIIPLGGSAVKSLLGWLWKEEVGKISRWDGWQIPSQRLNAWICCTWHPAYILRTDYGVSKKFNETRSSFFEKHLKAACRLEGRPWPKGPPDYKSKIKVILDPEQAAEAIVTMQESALKEERPIAFDYETDRLKPDRKHSRIVCCSMSDGRLSIAYPWHYPASAATIQFLRSEVRKIASNKKFEQRWSMAVLKTRVRNWWWDTMLAAHVLDNRSDITSIKFQAFCLLGAEPWDIHIKPFLKSNGSNELNRVTEIPLENLLHYCAMDSLMEWMVAKIQTRKIG